MDFWKVIEERKSVRRYQPEKTIPPEHLEKLVHAGKRAPSAGAIHPVDFTVVSDPGTIEKLSVACRGQKQAETASALIVVSVDPEKTAQRYREAGRTLFAIQDAAAATENILLGATALGLGACWLGGFEDDQVKEILGLPAENKVQAVVSLGYPKE